MNYIKKLCILKQVASGFAADGREVSALLTAESLGGRLTLTLAPIGFAPLAAGRYRCVVQDADGRREVFDLPVPSGACVRRAGGGLDIARGIGCAVCFVGGKATCVAFGKTGEGAYDPKAMCAAEGEAPARARQAPPAIPAPTRAADPMQAADPTRPTQAQTPPPDPPYDDEMLATENYFEKEGGAPSGEACAEKTGAAPAEETGGAQAADGLCSGGPCADGGAQAADGLYAGGPCADDGAPTGGGTEEGKAAEGGARAVTGENAQTLFRLHGGENAEPCYYDRVRADLDALFARHPAERELADCIPYSRWARVSFARNKYYAVGVICDEKKPQYICYGVPAEAHGEPPAALKGFCSFLPLSVFEPEGRGYWMMFQDAETGRCVRIERK